MRTLKTRTKYQLILAACVLLAVTGICFSVFKSHEVIDGTRGGIVAVGLTLAFIVGKSDSAAQVYARLKKITLETKEPSEADNTAKEGDNNVQEIAELKRRFEDLDNCLISTAEDEKTLNYYLVIGTLVGTVVSAFGDTFSTWIMHCLGVTPLK
jgi:hypothetical protein